MKKKIALLLAIITVVISLCVSPVTVYAKTGATTKKAVHLKDNKTYKKYDVTGDGKADKIKVKFKTYVNSKSGSGEATVYVNGKKIRKFSGGAAVDISLVAPTKKLTFIIADYHYKGGGNEAAAYRYVKGKFKKANSGNLYKPLTFGEVSKNTKSEIYVKVFTGRYEWGLFEDAYETELPFTAIYKIKSKKLVLKSKQFKAKSNSVTANKSFYLSSAPEYNDYDGPYVSKNETAQILALKLVKNADGYYEASYKISVDGENGWLTPEHLQEYWNDGIAYFK